MWELSTTVERSPFLGHQIGVEQWLKSSLSQSFPWELLDYSLYNPSEDAFLEVGQPRGLATLREGKILFKTLFNGRNAARADR